MKKFPIVSLLLALTVVAVLAGCDQSSTSTTPSSPSTNMAPPVATNTPPSTN